MKEEQDIERVAGSEEQSGNPTPSLSWEDLMQNTEDAVEAEPVKRTPFWRRWLAIGILIILTIGIIVTTIGVYLTSENGTVLAPGKNPDVTVQGNQKQVTNPLAKLGLQPPADIPPGVVKVEGNKLVTTLGSSLTLPGKVTITPAVKTGEECTYTKQEGSCPLLGETDNKERFTVWYIPDGLHTSLNIFAELQNVATSDSPWKFIGSTPEMTVEGRKLDCGAVVDSKAAAWAVCTPDKTQLEKLLKALHP